MSSLDHEPTGKTSTQSSEDDLRAKFDAPAVRPALEHRDSHSIFDKFRLALRTRTGKAMASLVLLGVGGGVVAAASGGENASSTRNPDTTTIAAPNPVETRAVGPVDPSELIGKPEADSMDNLNVKPSQEVIDQALKGVPVSEYETPQEAFVQLTNIYNVVELSGTADESVQSKDTPESIQLREELRSKLFSSDSLENGQFAQENLVRVNLGSLLEAINEFEITADGPLTWRSDFVANSINQTSENSFAVESTKTLYSNFGTTEGLDYSNKIKNVDVSKQGQSVSIDMVKDDGYWYFDSYETN